MHSEHKTFLYSLRIKDGKQMCPVGRDKHAI